MFFNDRRQAKKAASATTKAQIAAMAKQGTLKATTTSPGRRAFGKAERAAVREEVAKSPDWGTRADRFQKAATRVDKAKDVGGWDAPSMRKHDEKYTNTKQKKSYLPKKAK